MPTARAEGFGDVLVIRAAKNLVKGEQLTVVYTPFDIFPRREKALKRWFERCDCSLCELDRADGPDRLRRRAEISSRILSITSITSVRENIELLRKTYSPSRSSSIRPELFSAHFHLANLLWGESKYSGTPAELCLEAIMEDMKSFEADGIRVIDLEVNPHCATHLPVSTDHVPIRERVVNFLYVAARFNYLGATDRAERWLRAAIWREVSYP